MTLRALVVIVVTALVSQTAAKPAQSVPSAADLDAMLAQVALYPDQLLGPMLISAGNPATIGALEEWLRGHESLKGSELQSAAAAAGFGDSFVALVVFPDVLQWMASQTAWTTAVGHAFATDRSAVFASIQRLRKKAQSAGTLKTTPQQTVETKQTSGGENVIVIEPANPQVVYVPQYNSQTVYTTPATSTTVVVHEDNSSADAAVAGMIGFTAGVAIGAMWDNNYYYGPYGWHGGYMYNDAWDDWYDHREDAREDWQDHREDMADEYGDRAKNAQENRTERRENTSEQRTDRQQNRQQNGTTAQAARESRSGTSTSAASATSATSSARTQESRGFTGDTRAAQSRSGTGSTAFSNYSSGRSERAASSRGSSSRSSSRGSRRR
jgi:hypothetical protein